MPTKDYIPNKPPRALLIGHDPRLRNSQTIAGVALFADYHFVVPEGDRAWKSKKGLADAAFEQIRVLSAGKAFSDDEVYVTNLCNDELPNHPPRRGTVYIPREKAEAGVKHIEEILVGNPSIRYVFAMSQQVNYWLQELGFYSEGTEFKEMAAPKQIGVESEPPYYEAIKQKAFVQICGKVFSPNKPELADHVFVVPILHCRCYPLSSRFKAYESCYEQLREWFEKKNPKVRQHLRIVINDN